MSAPDTRRQAVASQHSDDSHTRGAEIRITQAFLGVVAATLVPYRTKEEGKDDAKEKENDDQKQQRPELNTILRTDSQVSLAHKVPVEAA